MAGCLLESADPRDPASTCHHEEVPLGSGLLSYSNSSQDGGCPGAQDPAGQRKEGARKVPGHPAQTQGAHSSGSQIGGPCTEPSKEAEGQG